LIEAKTEGGRGLGGMAAYKRPCPFEKPHSLDSMPALRDGHGTHGTQRLGHGTHHSFF